MGGQGSFNSLARHFGDLIGVNAAVAQHVLPWIWNLVCHLMDEVHGLQQGGGFARLANSWCRHQDLLALGKNSMALNRMVALVGQGA